MSRRKRMPWWDRVASAPNDPGITATYQCDRGHTWTCGWHTAMAPYLDACFVCYMDDDIPARQAVKAYKPVSVTTQEDAA
jgi:hypothetical protein